MKTDDRCSGYYSNGEGRLGTYVKDLLIGRSQNGLCLSCEGTANEKICAGAYPGSLAIVLILTLFSLFIQE